MKFFNFAFIGAFLGTNLTYSQAFNPRWASNVRDVGNLNIFSNPKSHFNLLNCAGMKTAAKTFKFLSSEYPIEVEEQEDLPIFPELEQILAPLYSGGYVQYPDHDYRDPNDFIVKSSTTSNPNPAELIELAKHMQHILGQKVDNNHTFFLDAAVLNTEWLTSLGKESDVSRMFPHTQIGVVPTKLVIQTKGSDYQPVLKTKEERNSTYVGSLNAVVNCMFEGGKVIAGTGSNEVSFDVSRWGWFAAAADAPFTVTPVTSGTRISIEYDMYDIKTPRKKDRYGLDIIHSDYGRNGDKAQHLLKSTALVSTQKTTTDVRNSTFKSIDAELQEQDAVLIGLQHLYPDFDRDGPSSLRGGDRALYELLSEQYDVSMAAATVLREYGHSRKYTGSLYISPGSVGDSRITADSKSKLFLPLRLTREHLLDEHNDDDDYCVESKSYIFYIVSALHLMKKNYSSL